MPKANRSNVYRTLVRQKVNRLPKNEQQESGQTDKQGQFKDKEAATDFFSKCLALFPFQVEKLLTDNGREFTLTGFKNRTTRPYTPRTNGLGERMNGLTKEATTKAHRYETPEQMIADLAGWQVRYNFCRKHRRIGNKTPYQATSDWYQKDSILFLREPTTLHAYR